MHSANRRRTRSSGSGFEQINGESIEVNSTVDKVSEQSNACVPLKTSEAVTQMENLEKSSIDANHHADLHHKMMENGNGGSNGFFGEELKPTPETGKKSSNTKFSRLPRELVIGLPCRGQFETYRSSRSAKSSKRVGGGGERNVRFSSHKRIQKSKEAAAASSADANSTPVVGPKKRMKDKKGEVKEDDEYTRIKKKLRYLVNRINYEQSLIDAYSLEGWKGSSLEKLRPEKELERATKEILRRKLKIRELFQHIDALCAEGSLPESLFDSDGEICSEDIFCAKCGSKDLSVDNDIILCDGFCDRGFHQYCVEPPLRKEDIPPDDESWLCPGCDCKDDSLGFLNDSLGTKHSLSDSWEKIFPEAAAALAGGDQNLNCDLPSDDSDDDEYDPEGLNDNENDEDGSDDSDESENEDGSSDDSDFTSASDEMIGSFKEVKDIMDLPSDDSEDDDYNPDAAARDEDKLQESSNSDSSSDSEDLEVSFKRDESYQQDGVLPLRKPGRKLLDDAIPESDAGLDDGVPRKRNVERLDYKKLYDEEYENVPSSSSDDEDWDKTAGKEESESAEEGNNVLKKHSSSAKDHSSTKKPRQRSKRTDEIDTLKAPQEVPRDNGCSGQKSSSSASKKTDPKTQRLFKSFQENRYPDNLTKEKLANELQMSLKQVNNWFRNRRSSLSKTIVSKEYDDKDPDAPARDEDKVHESSNSDPRAESENLETNFIGDDSNQHDEVSPLEIPGRKLLDDAILESDAGLVDVPRKRNVERLNYKKLYDEEYENVPTSSSDAEDWDKIAGKEESDSAEEVNTVPMKQCSSTKDNTCTTKPRPISKRTDKTDTSKAPQEAPRDNGCSGQKSSSSASKKTNPKTERLLKSFQENRYPDITTRENLAKELQMTVKQVNNWFRNTRFSTSKMMVSKEPVEKLRACKEGEGGETSIAGSSKQIMETETVTENKSRASETANPRLQKRRRK